MVAINLALMMTRRSIGCKIYPGFTSGPTKAGDGLQLEDSGLAGQSHPPGKILLHLICAKKNQKKIERQGNGEQARREVIPHGQVPAMSRMQGYGNGTDDASPGQHPVAFGHFFYQAFYGVVEEVAGVVGQGSGMGRGVGRHASLGRRLVAHAQGIIAAHVAVEPEKFRVRACERLGYFVHLGAQDSVLVVHQFVKQSPPGLAFYPGQDGQLVARFEAVDGGQ